MKPRDPSGQGRVVAVYEDHDRMERAVRRLHDEHFDMRDVSIVGRDFQTNNEPVGFVAKGDYVQAGAEIGAFVGGIFALCIGMGFLILPGVGFVIVAGPVAAALLAEIEGMAAGATVGGLVGALVAWGVPRRQAVEYQDHVKSGKFLVLVRGDAQKIEHARSVLCPEAPARLEVYRDSTKPGDR
jgi:uncharacterized membrane protein